MPVSRKVIGPGKYDDACTVARSMCFAEGAILIVVNGHKGHGISCQCPHETASSILPALLRQLADGIEHDAKVVTGGN